MFTKVGMLIPTSTVITAIPPSQPSGHFHLYTNPYALSFLKFHFTRQISASVSVTCHRSSTRNHHLALRGTGIVGTGPGFGNFDKRVLSCAELGALSWQLDFNGSGRVRVGRVFKLGFANKVMEWAGVPLLDQYLMTEMVPVFVLAICLCATLGMSLGSLSRLIREVVVSGLPIRVAAAAAMLQLPYFAAVSMPMACLAASLFGLGRLQSDMECVALLAAGVPLWRMLQTPLCLCLVAAMMKLTCQDCLVPYGSSQARKMVDAALTTHMQGLRQTEDLIYQEYGTSEEVRVDGGRNPSRWNLQRIWYATKMQGTCLSGLLVLEVLPSGYVHRVVVADAGEWHMDKSTWKFSNSTILDVSPNGSTRRILQVEGLQVPTAPLAGGRALWKPSLHELSRRDVMLEISKLERKLDLQSQRRTDEKSQCSLPNTGIDDSQNPEAAGNSAVEMNNRIVDKDMLNKLERFICQRDAAAFSCVVYGLVGALATLVQSGRGSRLRSRATPFAWAILGSMIYNSTSAAAAAWASARILNPLLSAWLPPFVGLSSVFSIFLLYDQRKHIIFARNSINMRIKSKS